MGALRVAFGAMFLMHTGKCTAASGNGGWHSSFTNELSRLKQAVDHRIHLAKLNITGRQDLIEIMCLRYFSQDKIVSTTEGSWGSLLNNVKIFLDDTQWENTKPKLQQQLKELKEVVDGMCENCKLVCAP